MNFKILDTAMGSELIKYGEILPEHIWSAKVNLSNPDLVYKIHKQNIDQGAHYITTNTFRTTPRAFIKLGLSKDKAFTEAKKSFDIALKMAHRASKNNILGSIAPLEDCYMSNLFPGNEIAYKEFSEIGSWLYNAGINKYILETMNSIKETEICIKALQKFKLPIWVSFNLLNSKKIRSGELLESAICMIKKYPVECVLLNCNPLDRTIKASRHLIRHWSGKWGVYPNLGIGEPSPDGIIKSYESNKKFITLIKKCLELNANIVGGCCGSSIEHIELIKKNIYKNI